MQDPNASRSQCSAYSGSISPSMLDRLRAGDGPTWSQLVKLFGPVVYQWCRRIGLQPADASDIVQEVLQNVSGKLETFRRDKPGDTFRGWLWTITRNKIHDLHRRRGAQPTPVGGTVGNEQLHAVAGPDPRVPENAPEVGEREYVVRRTLEMIRHDFSDTTWQAFTLTTAGGWTSAEVAEELGLTKAAVRQAKHRVLNRLREELSGLIDIEKLDNR